MKSRNEVVALVLGFPRCRPLQPSAHRRTSSLSPARRLAATRGACRSRQIWARQPHHPRDARNPWLMGCRLGRGGHSPFRQAQGPERGRGAYTRSYGIAEPLAYARSYGIAEPLAATPVPMSLFRAFVSSWQIRFRDFCKQTHRFPSGGREFGPGTERLRRLRRPGARHSPAAAPRLRRPRGCPDGPVS